MSSSREHGFGRDLRDTLRVLSSPIATFRDLRDRPAVLAPWLVVSIVTVVLTFFTLSITQRASVHMLAEIDDPDLTQSVAEQLTRMKWVSIVLAPAHVMARWGVTAALFWALGTFLLGGMPYRRALSVAAFAGLPAALGTGLDLAVTWFQGPEFTPTLTPVMVSASSLAALVPSLENPTWLAALIRQITLFSLWGAALWIVGLHETGRATWTKAAVVAGTVWGAFVVSAGAAELIQASVLQMSAIP